MTETNPNSASATEKIAPPMHDAYYKARKLYIFFSLLLFGYELIGLVGIDIKKVIEYVTKIQVKDFKNPEALVVGYLFLWVYSAVRFLIEWFQVEWDRRKVSASQWDFWVTHSIAVIALTVFATQQIPGFQVAKEPLPFLLPFFVGLTVPLIINFWKRSTLDDFNDKEKRRFKVTFIALFITASVLTLVYLLFFIDNLSPITILSLAGAFSIGMLKNVQDGITLFPLSSTTTPGDPSAPSDPSISPDTTQTTDENNKSEIRSTKSETNSKSEEPKQEKEPDRETLQTTDENNKSEAPNSKQIQKPKSKEPKQKKAPDRKTS